MIVQAELNISGSRAAIWAAIADIEHSAGLISGITGIEIVEKPAQGLVGLRWRETRLLFGKPATAEKWVTHAIEHESYQTRAESDGFIFLSTIRIAGDGPELSLTSVHESRPQSLKAKLCSAPMMVLFKGVMRKALLQDLNDIKAAVERR